MNKQYIKIISVLVSSWIFFSCDNNSTSSDTDNYDRLYVTLQGTHKVAVLNAHTLELIEEVAIDIAMMPTPHYVVLDEENGYWFVSAIMADKVAMYSMDTNELISTLSVDEDPAILSIDTSSKKLYSSRMMIMNMGGMAMGSTANLIDEISYSDEGMVLLQSYDSGVPTPHGLSLSDDKTMLLTASNTTDFLAKINIISGQIDNTSLDPSINDIPDLEINRLKPLEIVQRNGYAYITCTGGEWDNNGEYIDVNGQVQVWDVSSLEKLAVFEFDVNSKPWHIEVDPVENKIYVVLSGNTSVDNSAGVACLTFDGESSLSELWRNTDSNYTTLHGIAVSQDGQHIYVSGRGDGYVYKFDATSGQEINSVQLVSTGMNRTGGIAITKQ